jgi:hypothetical protein
VGRSTLFTSPLSLADFLLRVLFFAAAPFVIVAAAELFPVRGALVDVGLALATFILSEAVRKWAARWRAARWLLSEALAFEGYYRERPPRPFAYYLFYPLLFPYWLGNRDARREFLMFRGYTLGGFLVLVASLAWQYVAYWLPDLGLRAFLPAVAWTLTVETLMVLSLLMPIATTVVWYHMSFRRGRLVVLLLVGLVSTGFALARVASRRDPIVSYSTRERVRLRTRASRLLAHRTMIAAVRAAWQEAPRLRGLDGDGKVEGMPLERARQRLQTFYKVDEAAAFDLWGSPRRHPRTLVLYFEGRPGKPPIWVGIGADGVEIGKTSGLPRGALDAMRRAADGTDPVLPMWSDDVALPGR